MKKLLLFSFCFLSAYFISAQSVNTITLQPDAAKGKDAFIRDLSPNRNYSQHADIDALTIRYGSKQVTVRSLIEFDLSELPADAEILRATLTLSNNATSPTIPQSKYRGKHIQWGSKNNSARLERVLNSWEENAVTWNNQPASSSYAAPRLAPSTDPNQNYQIDLTNDVKDMHLNPAQNFGWMLKLNEEFRYRGLIFASSDNSKSELRPSLEIVYKRGLPGLMSIKTYPNPFSDQLTLEYALTEKSDVEIFIQDLSGRTVFTKSLNGQEAGYHNLSIESQNWQAPAGTYLMKVKINDFVFNHKLIQAQ